MGDVELLGEFDVWGFLWCINILVIWKSWVEE